MLNQYKFPRWNVQISEISREIRPKFRWFLKEDTNGWLGDVEGWIKDGTIKRINRVCLYDRNTLFDHIDYGGVMEAPCPLRVQLIPVATYVEFHNYESLPEGLGEVIEDTIEGAWDDSQQTYFDVSDLEKFPLVPYADFKWDEARHVDWGDDYTQGLQCEENTVGEVIDALIETYSQDPLW